MKETTKELKLNPALEFGYEPGGAYFGKAILCPYCGFDYVHLDSVVEGRKNKDVNTDMNGYDEWDGGRGQAVYIGMSGECGHRWYIRLGFHKGQTFIANEPDPTFALLKRTSESKDEKHLHFLLKLGLGTSPATLYRDENPQ